MAINNRFFLLCKSYVRTLLPFLSPKDVTIRSTASLRHRLVQYPGEFVVTFLRAYHIGFSHGFNCEEAANFGTPKWLSVAKEAAVRRVAMNFLPMLSHQQLFYLLTLLFTP
nr:probable lysine-specific demethylase ELF6 [Tanacetum cinerariifolium]GEY35742.1 probable lysine-specific demethylase ELF6 [Tanacetum cinerariifolium]